MITINFSTIYDYSTIFVSMSYQHPMNSKFLKAYSRRGAKIVDPQNCCKQLELLEPLSVHIIYIYTQH